MVLLGLLAACAAPQEGRPSRNLWLVEILDVAGLSSFGAPLALTDRPGYDDQPSFLPDGESLLYVSRQRSDVDVLRLDLSTRRSARMTDATADRFYSPQPLPEGDGFSAVLVGAGGFQRLVRFGASGGAGEPFADVAGLAVSYYAWVDRRTLAIVVRGNPSELRLVHLDEGRVEPLASAVGRTVQAVPGRRAVSWVSQESPAEWWIMEHDVDTGSTAALCRTLEGQVDHAWLPDGALLMGQETRLYRFKPGVSADWELVGDYAGWGLGSIGRIAVARGGRRLVFVAERTR